jgi:hypothetical protein
MTVCISLETSTKLSTKSAVILSGGEPDRSLFSNELLEPQSKDLALP